MVSVILNLQLNMVKTPSLWSDPSKFYFYIYDLSQGPFHVLQRVKQWLLKYLRQSILPM